MYDFIGNQIIIKAVRYRFYLNNQINVNVSLIIRLLTLLYHMN